MQSSEEIINGLPKGEIVVYTRPWFSKYYAELALAITREMRCKVSFISDYSVLGSYDLRNDAVFRYDNDNEGVEFEEIREYVKDIISRDRLLRKIDYSEAVKRIQSYYRAIKNFFIKRNVVCLISATVDQYVVDLLYLYCLINKIPFIGYHISVIPGYTLFTARGEIYNYRLSKECEVIKAIKKISCPNFRPSYVPGARWIEIIGLKRYFKNLLRNWYYRGLSFKRSARLNYHFETSILESRRQLSLAIFEALVWRYENIPTENFLYLPLQFDPECNTDYWDRQSSYKNYEDKVVRFINCNSPKWNIVVKEHPNMVGLRLGDFYRCVKSNGGIIVDPKTDHKSLLRRCSAVVTMNSSAGIEALCEGKVVLCLSVPYYKSNYHILKVGDQIVHPTEIEEVMRSGSAADALRVTVAKILSASGPTELYDVNFKPSKFDAILVKQSVDIFAKQIRPLIEIIRSNRVKPGDVYTTR